MAFRLDLLLELTKAFANHYQKLKVTNNLFLATLGHGCGLHYFFFVLYRHYGPLLRQTLYTMIVTMMI